MPILVQVYLIHVQNYVVVFIYQKRIFYLSAFVFIKSNEKQTKNQSKKKKIYFEAG